MNAPLDCRQGSVIVRFVLVFRGNVSLEMVEEIFMNGISNSAYTVDPSLSYCKVRTLIALLQTSILINLTTEPWSIK